MKHSKKICAHRKIIAALNADTEKYMKQFLVITLLEMYAYVVMTVSEEVSFFYPKKSNFMMLNSICESSNSRGVRAKRGCKPETNG